MEHFEQVGVPSAGDQSQRRVLDGVSRQFRFEKDGLEVALQMVYPNEGNVSYNANRLRVGKANEKGADEPGADCGRHGLDRLPIAARPRESFAHDWHDRPQVLPGGEFRDDSAVLGVDVNL
jgi:hypothetical protein